jgi:putative membrane protein
MTNPDSTLTHQWHRVSLLAIVYFLLSRGLRIIKELATNAAPAFAAILLAVDNKSFWFAMAGIGFIVLIILDVVILYATYRYRIEDDQIQVRQGFFTKELLNLKFARVQNINNAVPWYFKPFNLVRCTLDSAGSSSKEIDIPGITVQRSAEIANIINRYQKSHDLEIEQEQVSEEVEDDKTLFLSNWEVTKFGFTNSMIFVFAGALFPVIEKLTETTGIDFSDYLKQLAVMLPLPDMLAKIVLVFISMLLFGFLLLCVTAAGSFVRYHNYELYDEGKKLKRIAGLLERQTIYLNKNKVQGISIKQNVFARMLGRVTMYFQQTQADANGMVKKQPFIIPMLKPDEWQEQLKMIYPEVANLTLNFQPIEFRYFTKIVVYGFLLPVSLISLPLSIFVSPFFLLLYLVGIPIVGLAYLRYRRYGYSVHDNFLVIREGMIGTNYHVIERFKAQHLSEVTSPSQRRHRLGSLKIQMAYATIHLPYLKRDELTQIINRSLYLTEATQRSWM